MSGLKKKLSGATYRKNAEAKKIKLQEEIKKNKKLDKYFTVPQCEPRNIDSVNEIRVEDTDEPSVSYKSPEAEKNNECVETEGNATNVEEEQNFFQKPTNDELTMFLQYHPRQPEKAETGKPLPFNTKKAYFRQENNSSIRRQWLSVNPKTDSIFCYVCIAFAKSPSTFTDTSGFKDWKHVYERISNHEKTIVHTEAVKTFLREKSTSNIKNLLNTKQLSLRQKQIENNRVVLKHIIQTVKFLGKQSLAFRGHRNETASEFMDQNVQHGNFIETILLKAQSDPILQNHLEKCAETSLDKKKKRHRNMKENITGRGVTKTFLSNNTLNKIIKVMKEMLVEVIANAVNAAGFFSIMMDSTTDISCFDQCVIVVRFVNDENIITERLLAVKRVTSSSGKNLHQMLKDTLNICSINIQNCIADCFDGAANMSGQYNGVAAHLKLDNPNHMHTWCYAHVLNLVICESTECTTSSISLFGLLQDLAIFFKDSYKRLAEYEKTNPRVKLSLIGNTRWSSKSDALTKVFGHFRFWKNFIYTSSDRPQSGAVFKNIVQCLQNIVEDDSFNAKIKHDALTLLKRLLNFETILTAIIFSSIFDVSSPVSKYLQAQNLDYVQAWRQVNELLTYLESLRNNFETAFSCAKNFADFMNNELEEYDIVIKKELPVKKKSRKDIDFEGSEIKNYEIKVYNIILDRAIMAVRTRFEGHKKLYGDMECFDPKKFEDIVENGLNKQSLQKLCELLQIDKEIITNELTSFARFYPQLSLTSWENIYSSSDEDSVIIRENPNCNQCISCVYRVLTKCQTYSTEYENLVQVYKYLLTLPMTQVSCERGLSKLKIIKNRLRSSLAEENLEAFMLMSSEFDILTLLKEEEIIARLCRSSVELSKCLLV